MKVEPLTGESGRGALPRMLDPQGQPVGSTFLRNNLGKRSISVDLKHPEGRELILSIAPHFDVICENFKTGTMDRLGLGYEDISRVHPSVIYASGLTARTTDCPLTLQSPKECPGSTISKRTRDDAQQRHRSVR